uniref:YagK/YfjJ C-terminal domain-containing protein n=1 Tax=uncultured prokaryote TaxID=198431 RepID=A0A0H5QPA2_9ZZZZ|nr:hypothetical protein [uncultured prokaryote]
MEQTKQRGIQTHVTDQQDYPKYELYNGSKSGDGFYEPILDSLNRIVTEQLDQHTRVNIIRFDIGGLKCSASEANAMVVNGFKRMRQRLQRYTSRDGKPLRIKSIGTGWVREYSKLKGIHYHCVVVFKAVFRSDRVMSSGNTMLGIFKLIADSFSSLAVNFGTRCWKTDKRKHHFYTINRNDTSALAEAMKGLSYLAKVSTKQHAADGSRFYSFSKIKHVRH